MKIETIEVSGFASALKAARLPYNKTEKSLLYLRIDEGFDRLFDQDGNFTMEKSLDYGANIVFHQDDIELLSRLEITGDEHAKPLRGVLAYADITAPIDWWGEAETYRSGHERLFSSSTMNTEGKKLHGKALRKALNEVSFGREIKKIDFFSYQTLRRMVSQRYNHRKIEWHEFIDWVRTLPLSEELILRGLDEKLSIHDKLYAEYLNEE